MTMPENDYEMFSRRPDQLIPGWNVDPIDIGAGLKMLYEIGWGWDPDSPTVMTITYALQRWARGEEAEAEKLAITRNVEDDRYGIDFTSWRVVLAAAIAAGTAKLEAEGRPVAKVAKVAARPVVEVNLP